jgi:site-specific DNA recombinase
MVGEVKKGRCVYYHCTGNKGRCGDPYVREEKLTQEFSQGLNGLVIPPPTLSWLERTMAVSDQTEQGAREQAMKQLKAEHDRLQARVDTMYLDRLDGRISAEFFDAKSKQWRDQQKEIDQRMKQLETKQLETTTLNSAAEAVQIMKSVSDACGAFGDQTPRQQWALALALVQQATRKAGKFELVLAEPYSILAHSNSVSQSKERRETSVRAGD